MAKSSLPLLLQKWALQVKANICTCLCTAFLAFHLLSKKQPWQWPLTLEKKHGISSELAKHRNQVCKTSATKQSGCFFHHCSRSWHARTGNSLPRSGRNLTSNQLKSNSSRGEFRKTSSRSAAPSAPLVSLLKHLEWSKEDCGDKRTSICCRSSCKWLLQVRPFATVYVTFLAFQCCQMLAKKLPWQWPLTLEKKTRVISTNWPNIANDVCKTRHSWEVCFFQMGPAGTPQLLPCTGRNLIATTQSTTSPGESSARLPAGLRPHRHLWCHCQSTWNPEKRTVCGQKDGNLLPLLLQMTCVSPTSCNCLFHIFGLSMLPNFVKETAVTMALEHSRKRTRVISTNWPNIATKFARRGTMTNLASLKLVQLAPRSFCHAADGIREQKAKLNFSTGELRKTSSRSVAPSAPLVSLLKHLECSKETVGIKGRQSVTAPLANDFCKSGHLQLSMSHFWPFNVAKCWQRNCRDNGP